MKKRLLLAKELWGVKIGDNITLNTPDGDLKYTISGFYEDDTEFNKIIDGACVYMNRVAFNEVCSLNGVAHNSQFYIRFEKESGLKKNDCKFETAIQSDCRKCKGEYSCFRNVGSQQ